MQGDFEVYDIEVTKSCITYTGLSISTKKYSQFVIHKDRDETLELIDHIKSLAYGIGFNVINFDYPVLHYLINTTEKLIQNAKTGFLYDSVEEIIELVFLEAQRIIELQNRDQFSFNIAIKDSECYFKQIDLYRIWHYNNPARRTSLKSLEISMNFPNVMEMEIDFRRDDITLEEVMDILIYNKNDVDATYEFYLKSINKLKLRSDLNTQYNLNCLNFPDVKIGENLMIKLYSEKTKMSWWDVKKLRTYRSEIKLKDCVFPYINFKTESLKKLLDKIQSTTIKNTKGEFSFEQNYHGIKLVYGTGGIHAVTYSGIYESNETHIIKSADVSSLYPNLAIQNKVYPEHLGEIFCDIYEKDIVEVRMKAKKAGNKLIADALKLAANGAYG